MHAKEHYENHLAPVYDWMVGDFETKQREQGNFFIRNNILPGENKLAVDLGAGHGLQSISLATLGFQVIAVDFNKQLLYKMSERKNQLPIETVHDDMVHFLSGFHQHPELIVCMGDTLTHLESVDQVQHLLRQIAGHLDADGKVILSFRNYEMEQEGEARFINVRSDDMRILTCFLEFFDDRVVVYDILYEKHEGMWRQKVSSYPKLRLKHRVVVDTLAACGVVVAAQETIAGLNYLIGQKRQ